MNDCKRTTLCLLVIVLLFGLLSCANNDFIPSSAPMNSIESMQDDSDSSESSVTYFESSMVSDEDIYDDTVSFDIVAAAVMDWSEGLEYAYVEGIYSVKGIGSCKDPIISIPSFHDGQIVTAIAGAAFAYQKQLRAVLIPGGVTKIRSWAFAHCKNLTDLVISSDIKEILPYAFQECDNLRTVYYSGTEEEWESINVAVGNEAFKNAKMVPISVTMNPVV